MTIVLILQAAAFLVLLVGLVLYARVVESKTRTGRRVLWLNLTALLLIGGSLALSSGIVMQEKTGRSLGLSGGVSSDARTWLKQHGNAPPNRTDVGRNITMLSDGIAFLRARKTQLSPETQAQLEELSRVPERPKRLLSAQEESTYFAGANDVYVLIHALAKDGSDQK